MAGNIDADAYMIDIWSIYALRPSREDGAQHWYRRHTVLCDVQVGNLLCLRQMPDAAETCSSDFDGVLNGALCSGNGIFSQSSSQCICNSGWQVLQPISMP